MPGGANWNNPTTTRNYATEVLQDIKARDEDALTLLGGTAPTNIPVGAIKYNRATDEFQEWDGAAFNPIGIAISGGGTGATTASAARTNLGLGTMATQNSNAVSITGGTISGISSLSVSGNSVISGVLQVQNTGTSALMVQGGAIFGNGYATALIGTDGRIPAITSAYFADLSAISGVAIPAGLIAMFDTACPVGWTRFSALDNKFPRGAAAYGATGGADTHAHTVAGHTHSLPANTSTTNIDHTHSGTTSSPINGTGAAQTGAGQGITDSSHQHTVTTGGMSANNPHSHPIGGTTGATAPATDSISNIPAYLAVVWCRKN